MKVLQANLLALGTIEIVGIAVGALVIVGAILIAVLTTVYRKADNKTTAQPAAPQPAVEESAPVEEPVAEEPVAEDVPEETPVEEPAPVEEEPVEEVAEVPVEEPVEEEEPVVEPVAEPIEEPVAEEEPEAENTNLLAVLEKGNVLESESGAVVQTADGFLYLNFNKSFQAKLIQAKDEVREYYNTLKNFVLHYKKVSTRMSWQHESINAGRNKLGRFVLRGKSLYLYLPLNPDDYADTKYKVERAEAKRFEEFPCLYRIKNPRRVKFAQELLALIMEQNGLEYREDADKDYVKDYPYEETLPLIKRKLIKLTKSNRKVEPDEHTLAMFAENKVRSAARSEVKVSEVNELLTDEEADRLVVRGTRKADTTRKGIVNIDRLAEAFEDGTYVTIEEMKARVPGFDKRMTYVKVLARGTLNKRLTVEADDFSAEAKKMILLTGGQVVKTLSE